MKFSLAEYRITKEYEEKLRNRIALFKEKTKDKKSIVNTFVSTYGIADGMHSSIVYDEVTLDGLILP